MAQLGPREFSRLTQSLVGLILNFELHITTYGLTSDGTDVSTVNHKANVADGKGRYESYGGQVAAVFMFVFTSLSIQDICHLQCANSL